MKKTLLSIFCIALISFSFAREKENNKTNNVEIKGGKVTIINDTDKKVKVHTGSGSVSLNPRGGKTSISCDTGKSIKVDGETIFKNNSDFCGETVKLSDYL